VADAAGLTNRVIPLAKALPHWSTEVVSQGQAAEIMNGTWLPVPLEENLVEGDKRMFLDPQGNPLALVQATMRQGVLHWAILRGLWSPASM